MKTPTIIASGIALGVATLASAAAPKGAHLWRFNEIYSSPDGTIQFIEMKECCGAGNEVFIEDKDVSSETTGLSFLFPNDLPCSDCTANKHLLLATQAFADLPGMPEPDFIIPEGLFSLDADTITWWLYSQATISYESGEFPLDGTLSWSPDGPIVNSPTNFADETGTVQIPCDPADIVIDGQVDVSDLLVVIANWGACGKCIADITGDGFVDVADVLEVLAAFGGC